MDTTLRQTLAGAFLATGCLVSAPSHAYNAADDAEAQDREVKAAYDRGYKAAKDELARQAAKGTADSADAAAATSAQKTAGEPARKPILDIKHVYSDASDVETVQEVPVTSKPLPDDTTAAATAPATKQAAAQSAAPEGGARNLPPKPAARRPSTAVANAAADSDALPNPQPVQRASVQPRNAGTGRSTGRVLRQDAPPPEELADDDYDTPMPRRAQVYSTGPQYIQPRAQYAQPQAQYVQPQMPQMQYAQPPVSMPPRVQTYGYVPRPTYAATRPYPYYGPPAAWADEYQPSPYAGQWHWSPQYGRWLYY
jgi:hypothetical protein